MNYTIVDIENWSRASLFNFYIGKLRVVMSLTVDIDVTHLLDYVHKNGLRFYPAMIWAVSKVANSHDEFKYGWKDDVLVKWDYIFPSYANFNKSDETFTKYPTEYRENLEDFHSLYIADREKYKDARGLQKSVPNAFDVSCLPWVNYRHFDVHVFDEGKFIAPVVTWGKYEQKDGRFIMPLSVNIHHAVCDGFHLSRFFNEVQQLIDSL